jgi:hypothetical protein
VQKVDINIAKPGNGLAQIAGTTTKNNISQTSSVAQFCSSTVWQLDQASMNEVYEREILVYYSSMHCPAKFALLLQAPNHSYNSAMAQALARRGDLHRS